MIAATLGVFVLAGVLTANLQVIRGGVRLTQYMEMDGQVRRALEFLARDLKAATVFKLNSSSDVTLTIPATSGGGTAQVTYAWTSAGGTFFRVAGANSASLVGRLELVRGISALPGGAAGLTFSRFDRDGVATTSDAATKSLQIDLAVGRSAGTTMATSSNAVSARYTLRTKRVL